MKKISFFLFVCLSFQLALAQQLLKINNDSTIVMLTAEGAKHFADMALKCIHHEYPNKTNHMIMDASENVSPQELHPAFYGCLDWHSSVHGHWMLVKLLKLFPEMPGADSIRMQLNQTFTADKLLAEAKYFERKGTKSFERMYGWSWLLKLDTELATWADADAQRWHLHLQPLTLKIVGLYNEFLPKQTYPIRSGVHPNTAFGLRFALDYARIVKNDTLEKIILEKSRDYYLKDEFCPGNYEPGGSDFFSPCLEEAFLMSKVLSETEFRQWLNRFFEISSLQQLMKPAIVSDRGDYQIVHLDGLNLSRAWCMKGIASALSVTHPVRSSLQKSALRHILTTVPHIASGEYSGEHWLASFAVSALIMN